MSAILAYFGGKGLAVAAGAGLSLAFTIAIKFLPNRISNYFGSFLGKQIGSIDNIKDPIRKGLYLSLAMDLVRIAEFEIPDKGKGKEKYMLVADKLCSVLPFLKGQNEHICELIESAVAAVDSELKKNVPN